MAGLSKSRLLAHRQCPKRLWLQINKPELQEYNDGSTARMAAGTYAGEVARSLYPDGVLIDAEQLSQALLDTQAAMADSTTAIFEATFQADGVLIRADLLLPEDNGYRLAEVKSSTSVKDYHYEDAAVQAWVAKSAGVRLTRTEIAHIDNTFVYPGDENYQGLFAHVDISKSIIEMEAEVPDWIAAAQQILAGTEPAIEVGPHCEDPFTCPFLSYCYPEEADQEGFPPEILPRAKTLAAQLRSEGYDDLRNVPEQRLNSNQQRIRRVSINNQAELNPEAGKILNALPYPWYYLDFETIQLAVPVWAGTRPYMQIPFQWSCHIETADGNISHHEFLADGLSDPRRVFVESLIATLNQSGTILVYNAGFENSRMRELAIAYPDLAADLHAIIERVFDLLPLARAHYYHPDMLGSWSIKAVLPTIAPELSYDDLEVSHGMMAMESFAELMQQQTTLERRVHLRAALLKYCERDTWAMVRIARFFQQGINDAIQ
jgi:hypothetical protein